MKPFRLKPREKNGDTGSKESRPYKVTQLYNFVKDWALR